VAEKDGKRIAIEIETGKSNYIYNVKKELKAGFDEIIVVALNNKIKEKIVLVLKKSVVNKDKMIKLLDITEFTQIDILD